MPGTYTHTTRATGTVLTATIYNTDHQNHIDNQTPSGTDDYSANQSQMQSTVEPGEVGTESLATSLQGELERLRFALKESKAAVDSIAAQWYSSPLVLTNKSGGAVAAGDVVVVDTTTASSFTTTTTAGYKGLVGVSLETIANDATGKVAISGRHTVKVTGATTIGRYLKTHSVAKEAVDTAVLVGTAVPEGAFAVALTSTVGAGSVTALIFGGISFPSVISKPSFVLSPESAVFPTTNFPQLVKNSDTNWTSYTLDYDQTTAEAAFWFVTIPSGVAFSAAALDIYYRTTVITGTFQVDLTTLTRADAEAWDTAGTLDSSTADTVPGTAGQVGVVTTALTVTGWAAGEVLLIKIARNIADTAAADIKLINAVLRLT